MTRYVNEDAETKVQVLDSNGNPATGATVLYKIYDEADVLFDSGSMSHIADGIFTLQWTPDAVGEWTFEAYSSNPKFRDSKVYKIESILAFKHKPDIYDLHEPPDLNTWYTPLDVSGGARVKLIAMEQTNNESATKNIEWEFTIDGVVVTDTLASEHGKYYSFVTTYHGGIEPIEGYEQVATFGVQKRDWVSSEPYEIESSEGFSEMHAFKFRYRMTSAPGTNQEMHCVIVYDKLERES